jgi:hypothetical protein
MEQQIKFTANGGKAEKMKAGDIAGFGFQYENTWYQL